jgi:hypothetical protein
MNQKGWTMVGLVAFVLSGCGTATSISLPPQYVSSSSKESSSSSSHPLKDYREKLSDFAEKNGEIYDYENIYGKHSTYYDIKESKTQELNGNQITWVSHFKVSSFYATDFFIECEATSHPDGDNVTTREYFVTSQFNWGQYPDDLTMSGTFKFTNALVANSAHGDCTFKNFTFGEGNSSVKNADATWHCSAGNGGPYSTRESIADEGGFILGLYNLAFLNADVVLLSNDFPLLEASESEVNA